MTPMPTTSGRDVDELQPTCAHDSGSHALPDALSVVATRSSPPCNRRGLAWPSSPFSRMLLQCLDVALPSTSVVDRIAMWFTRSYDTMPPDMLLYQLSTASILVRVCIFSMIIVVFDALICRKICRDDCRCRSFVAYLLVFCIRRCRD